MRIITVNRNYFVTGGPEKYFFSLRDYLPDVEFIPFCVRFSQNKETGYSKYFVDPPGGQDNVYFKDFKMSATQKLAYAAKSIYSLEAKHNLEALINDTKPDVAFFLNAVYFTDSIIDACKNNNIPIVWRLSDYNKICANYLMLRDGQVCDDCIDKGIKEGVRNRCGGYQRSMSAALVKYASMQLSRIRNLYEHVNYFVTPSAFMREKMIQGGFPAEKLVHIPTFANIPEMDIKPLPKVPNILYVGRLSAEKGVETLLDSFALIRDKEATLSIIGDCSSEYAQALIDSVPDTLKSRVNFHGFVAMDEVAKFYDECSFFVLPSLCYENLPNVILEGMSHGRPALVSRLGSMIETVIDGKTGYHFEAGNAQDLAVKIDSLLANYDGLKDIGKMAKEYVLETHNPEKHVVKIRSLFDECASIQK